VRRTLELPHNHLGPAKTSKGFKAKYNKETAALRARLPVINASILKQLQNHIFYNKLSTHDIGDVCEIESAETELARYSINEDPDTGSRSPLSHNDDIEDHLTRYPVSIRIHADASQRDVTDFIKKNWDSIKASQQPFAKDGARSLKNSKTGLANKERDSFIYANRNLSHKKIAGLVYKKFKKDIDMGTVGKILSIEKKRRALEHKLETAEEKLIERALDNEQFGRLKARYREQINGIDDQIFKLERSKNVKVDVIQHVLAMIREIGSSYEKANPDLKRLYLGLFWERFEAENKVITKAIKSPIVQAIEAVGAMGQQKRATPSPLKSSRCEEVILRPILGA
jgi:hypothetical protein